MVLHNHLDGVDAIFSTMVWSLASNTPEKRIEGIIIRTYHSESEDSRWEYEPVYYLWLDVELGSDSSDDGSSD